MFHVKHFCRFTRINYSANDFSEYRRVLESRPCNSICKSGKDWMFHVKHWEVDKKINDIRKLKKTKRTMHHEEAHVGQ